MKRYLPQLDGLRAVAVLLVIGTHTGYIPGGYVGVDVFFALSGYLITTILLREHTEGRWSITRFYVRRARRLYPALIVLLVVLIPFAGNVAPGHYLGAAVLSGTYLADIGKAAGYPMGGLVHTWSLAVEEQFYLLWPLFLVFSLRHASRRVILVVTLVLAALPLAALVYTEASIEVFLPTGRGADILLGCALALALDGRVIPRLQLVAVVSAFVLASLPMLAHDGALGGVWETLTAVATTGLIAGVVHGGPLAWLLSRRPLVWLGQRSYGVYLWHVPIAWMAGHHDLIRVHGSVRVLLPTLVGSIACASLSYRYVETPLRRSAKLAAGSVPGETIAQT